MKKQTKEELKARVLFGIAFQMNWKRKPTRALQAYKHFWQTLILTNSEWAREARDRSEKETRYAASTEGWLANS